MLCVRMQSGLQGWLVIGYQNGWTPGQVIARISQASLSRFREALCEFVVTCTWHFPSVSLTVNGACKSGAPSPWTDGRGRSWKTVHLVARIQPFMPILATTVNKTDSWVLGCASACRESFRVFTFRSCNMTRPAGRYSYCRSKARYLSSFSEKSLLTSRCATDINEFTQPICCINTIWE